MATKKLLSAGMLALVLACGHTLSQAQIGSAVTINVTPAPILTGLSNQTYCSGAIAAALPFAGTGTSYQISGGSTVGLTDQVVTTAFIPAFTAATAGSGDISATITVTPLTGGCSGTPATYVVTIPTVPTATAPPNQSLCAGAPVSLVTFTGQYADEYQVNGGTSGLSSQTLSAAEIPAYTATASTGAHTITITPYNNACPGTSVAYTATVVDLPTVTVPSDIELCAGAYVSAAFTISFSALGYNWVNDNAATGIPATGVGTIYEQASAVTAQEVSTISVTPYNNGCEGAAQIFTVTVNPKPEGSLSALSASLCTGTQAQLEFDATSGTAPYQIEYTVNGGPNVTEAITSNPGTFNVSSPNAVNTYQLMKITDDNGCIIQ